MQHYNNDSIGKRTRTHTKLCVEVAMLLQQTEHTFETNFSFLARLARWLSRHYDGTVHIIQFVLHIHMLRFQLVCILILTISYRFLEYKIHQHMGSVS